MSFLEYCQQAGQTPPNVLICGTPGVGKTSLAEELAQRLGFRHTNITQIVQERQLYDGYDEARQCHILDEDKLIDELEDENDLNVPGGGHVIDYHGCDFFPERYFQLVVVLRTDTNVLWDRLQSRNYLESKIRENVEAEIMQVLLEEAKDSYSADIVLELPSNTPDDMENNINIIAERLKQLVDGR